MTRRVWEQNGSVFLREEGPEGERIRRFYVVVPWGSEWQTGYVWEADNSRDGRHQVCERLARQGNTLRSTEDGLVDVIRSEYRQRQRGRA